METARGRRSAVPAARYRQPTRLRNRSARGVRCAAGGKRSALGAGALHPRKLNPRWKSISLARSRADENRPAPAQCRLKRVKHVLRTSEAHSVATRPCDQPTEPFEDTPTQLIDIVDRGRKPMKGKSAGNRLQQGAAFRVRANDVDRGGFVDEEAVVADLPVG